MKNTFRYLLIAAALIPAIALPVLAEDISVPVTAGEENYSVSVAREDAASALWCAAYTAEGRMLAAVPVEADTAPDFSAVSGAAYTKLFQLDASLSPVKDAKTVYLPGGWEERNQYGDILSNEERFREAVAAYTQAIAMDGSQAIPYVNRGNAAVRAEETEDSLSSAKADYNRALTLDTSTVGAYLGLADIAIRQNDLDAAKAALERGQAAVGENEELQRKLDSVKSGNVSDSSGHERRRSGYDANGDLRWYHIMSYDSQGKQTDIVAYRADGSEINRVDYVYDEQGRCLTGYGFTIATGELGKNERELDSEGRTIKRTGYHYDNGNANQELK